MSRVDPLKEQPWKGSVIARTDSQIHVTFPEHFDDLSDGTWRLDLGRPNLMYERIRTAISHFMHDPKAIMAQDSSGSSDQFILQGTELREALLRSFHSPPVLPEANAEKELKMLKESMEVDISSEGTVADANSAPEFPFEDMGAFKDDQRIVSWVRRYSRPDPIVMDSDPPLANLNASQKRAMAAMIGRKISLIQGVGHHSVPFFSVN